MVLAMVDLEAAYYAVISCCDHYFSGVVYDNLLNFVHLAVFWKIITNMSMYSIESNLVMIKLESLNFVDEAINTFAQSIDIAVNDIDKMMIRLLQIVEECLHNDTSECVCEPVCHELPSNVQSETSFTNVQSGLPSKAQSETNHRLLMQYIIHELLDQVSFDDDQLDLSDDSLYNTLQLFKQINSDITIEQKQIQD